MAAKVRKNGDVSRNRSSGFLHVRSRKGKNASGGIWIPVQAGKGLAKITALNRFWRKKSRGNCCLFLSRLLGFQFLMVDFDDVVRYYLQTRRFPMFGR